MASRGRSWAGTCSPFTRHPTLRVRAPGWRPAARTWCRLKNAGPELSKRWESMSPEGRELVGATGFGVTLGGLRGLANHLAPESEKKRARKTNGPLRRITLRHPGLSGAAFGGAGLASAVTAGRAMAKKHPRLVFPTAMGAAMAPGLAYVAADRVLKNRE